MIARRIYQLAATVLVALALVLAGGCGPAQEVAEPPTTQPSAVREPTAVPEATVTSSEPTVVPRTPMISPEQTVCKEMDLGPIEPADDIVCSSPSRIPPPHVEMPFYAPTFLIVTGPETKIDPLLRSLADDHPLRFVPVHQLCLWYVDAELWTACTAMHFGAERSTEAADDHVFVMRLYIVEGCTIPQGKTFLDVPGPVDPEVQAMILINETARGGLRPVAVAADLSYEVGGPTSGSEWQGAGSPWTSELVKSTCVDSPTTFKNQWIWGAAPGINLPETSRDGSLGSHIRVGLFDTSPWIPGIEDSGLGSKLQIEQLPYSLGYKFPIGEDAEQVSEHGAFVAGLVHAAAAEAEIRLYPVLDAYARGDLFTLNASLHQFIQDAINDRERGANDPIRGAVINLSLGVHSPQELIQRGLEEPKWEKFGLSKEQVTKMASWTDRRSGAPSLRFLLGAAKCLGIPTVAASGNESASTAQIPASFSDITLSVGSSDSRGEVSCFSNPASVYAPGGEGGTCGAVEACSCQPAACKVTCASIPSTPRPPYLPPCDAKYLLGPTSTGYVYWAGTSFSTPLVTGVVARRLEQAAKTAADGSGLVEDTVNRIEDCARSPHSFPTPPFPKVPLIDAALALSTSSCP